VSINNIGPEPLEIEVYILNHYASTGRMLSATVHRTYDKALELAVVMANIFVPKLELNDDERKQIRELASSPTTYGTFLVLYGEKTGEEFRITEAMLEL